MAADNRSLMELPKLNFEGILIRLPFPSQLVCCCVSKSLLNLIKNDSEYAKMHFAKSEPLLLIQSLHFSSFHMIELDSKTTSLSEIKPTFNFPFSRFAITHSSNGLLLLESNIMANDFHRCIVLNPVTGEYTILPDGVDLCRHVSSAFFYSPKLNLFKVLHVVHRMSPDPGDASSDSFMEVDQSSNSVLDLNSVAELDPSSDSVLDSHSVMELNLVSDSDLDDSDLYSDTDSDSDSDSDSDDATEYSESDIIGELFVGGSDSWESLGNLTFYPPTLLSHCHMDNTTHWLCSDKNVPNLIVFFNFESNQFGEISGPAHMDKSYVDGYDEVTLFVLGNCLSVFDSLTTETKIYIWRMKEYGVNNPWTRDFVIDKTSWGAYCMYNRFTPLICRTNGEIVMVSSSGYILFYDLLKKKGRIVNHPPLWSPYNVMIHTPSLMSLRDVVKGSNLEVMNVASRFVHPDSELILNNYLLLAKTFSE